MVVRRWLKVLSTALGAGLVLGAGQLGVAYGLGILRWDQPYGTATGDAWSAQLTWVAWIAEVTVVLAAVGGLRAARPGDRDVGMVSRVIAACAATIGGAVTVPLVTLPAATARPPVPFDPALVAALTASAGLLVGLIVAIAVVSVAPVSGDALTTIAVMWLLAIGTLTTGMGRSIPRLGMLDVTGRPTARPWEMLAVAALLAAVVAGIARWVAAGRVAVAAAGAGGPALVAAAYLIAGRGVAPNPAGQADPYRMALIGLGAGVVVSTAVALLPGPRSAKRTRTTVEPGAAGSGPPAPALAPAGSVTHPAPRPAPAVPAEPAVPAQPAQPPVTPPRPAPPPTPPAARTAETAEMAGPRPAPASGRRHRAREATPAADPHLDWVRDLGSGD